MAKTKKTSSNGITDTDRLLLTYLKDGNAKVELATPTGPMVAQPNGLVCAGPKKLIKAMAMVLANNTGAALHEKGKP